MIPPTVRQLAIHATPEPEYESVPMSRYVRTYRETGPGSLLGVGSRGSTAVVYRTTRPQYFRPLLLLYP